MLTRIMEDAEIEESLAEMDLKRKAEEQTSQEGRKPKKRRMERLEGWGYWYQPRGTFGCC